MDTLKYCKYESDEASNELDEMMNEPLDFNEEEYYSNNPNYY